MGRGFMYVVTKDPDTTDEPYYTQDDFYDKLGELTADYVKDEKPISLKANELLKSLSQYGFETGISDTCLDTNGDPCRWFKVSHSSLANYYRRKLKRAKRLLADMPLQKYMDDLAWDVRMALDNHYGDMIGGEDISYGTFDQQLKDLDYDTAYYITNIIYIH